MAAVALVTEAVELGVGPHRELSAVFLGVGLLVGALVGRNLGRELRDWSNDAAVLDADEATRVGELRPSAYAVLALAAAAAVALFVPIAYHVPTPLPGALAAGAVQTLLQSRYLDPVEQRRRGRIVRPTGRFSFDGSELRLLPYAGPPSGTTSRPG
jgi:hypothetical protein